MPDFRAALSRQWGEDCAKVQSENIKFVNMKGEYKVKEGVYIPDMGIDYPDDPFQRLVKVKVQDSTQGRFRFDETYPYIDHSFKYRFNRRLNAFVLSCIDALYHRVCLGLKIEGRENLRKYKKELSRGAVSVSNHVWREDASMICHAVQKYYTMHIPMYAKHFNNKFFYWMIRYMGGVPVPESMAGMRGFNDAFDEFHSKGEWIHVFPEEVRWDYHKFIRPFRKGAFSMAYKYDVPIVPCVITYRERKGIFRLTGKKNVPLFTVKVLEPIFPDKSKNRKEEVDELIRKSHAAMEAAAGIELNPWPALPEE